MGWYANDYSLNGKRQISKGTGWANDLAAFFGYGKDTAGGIADDFRNQYGSQLPSWLNDLSDAELGSILDGYWKTNSQILGNKTQVLDTDALLAQLETLSQFNGKVPEDVNKEKVFQQGAADVSLDDLDQSKMFDSQLGNVQNNYDSYKQSVLGSQNNANNQLSASVTGELSRARQSALESGASAGLRLANNVNVMLSSQNQQRTNSLSTANNLAQMLMNQQSTALGIQGNKQSTLGNQRQRIASNQQTQYGNARNTNQAEWSDYDAQYQRATGDVDAGLAGAYKTNQYRNNTRGY